jgi:hypothetical protein
MNENLKFNIQIGDKYYNKVFGIDQLNKEVPETINDLDIIQRLCIGEAYLVGNCKIGKMVIVKRI